MGWLDDIQNSTVMGSLVHSARGWEQSLDSDHDGSLADQVGNSLSEHVPVVGGLVGHPLSQMGDCLTDMMGTRDQGVFSHQSTLDAEHTTDTDYAGDGVFQSGIGRSINEAIGLDLDAAVMPAMAAGALTGGVGTLAVAQAEVLHEATRGLGGRIPITPHVADGADWIRDVPDLRPDEI